MTSYIHRFSGKNETSYSVVKRRTDTSNEERHDVLNADIVFVGEVGPLGVEFEDTLFGDDQIFRNLWSSEQQTEMKSTMEEAPRREWCKGRGRCSRPSRDHSQGK